MKPSEAKKIITECLRYNIQCYMDAKKKGINPNDAHRDYVVPMMWGNPGLGKTSITRQAAAEMDVPSRTTIVAQYDAGELAGFPMPDRDTRKMVRYRPDFLPDGKGENGEDTPAGIWLLDELVQAPVAVQNLCAQITNEWRIGEHRIAPAWTIVCAGNHASNRAGTNNMPTHLRDRLMHIEVESDRDDWLEWANRNHIRPEVTAYIRKNPASLEKFDNKADVCPSPRSWAKVNTLLNMELDKSLRSQALGGLIGKGEASNFESYMRIADKMPDPQQIIDNPTSKELAPVFESKDADILILLLANIAHLSTPRNFGNVVKYLNRMKNKEFAVYCIKDAMQRDEKITETRAFSDWCSEHGADLLM